MAGSRNRGPIGRSGGVQDLNDGTTILELTARPGTIDIERVVELVLRISQPQKLSFGPQPNDLDYIRRLLRQFLETTDAFDLRDIVVQWFGYQCFSVGVIVGIGEAVIDTVEGLLSLVKTLVLAELHDIRTKGPDWWNLFNPVMSVREISLVPLAEVAGIFFEEELRKAAEERDALIRELLEAIQNPEQFFDSIMDDYKKDWEDFNKYMNDGTPEGKFRAGMILGNLLFDVLSLITGVVGAAKAAAKVAVKIAAKLPRLFKLGQSFARSTLKSRRSRRVGGRGGTSKTQNPDKSPDTKKAARGAEEATERDNLLQELKRAGVKHDPDAVVTIAKTKDGKVIFLEKGKGAGETSKPSGLKHIVEEHKEDFARKGIPEDQIPDAVMKAVTEGKIVGSQGRSPGRPIYEVEINGQVQHIAVTTGNNGYIVGANPVSVP